jgi:glycerol-3-phosphate dehydrogenase
MARHYARTYGSNSELILDKATSLDDLGEHFGHEFYEAELRYLVEHEWVRRWMTRSGVGPNKVCG